MIPPELRPGTTLNQLIKNTPLMRWAGSGFLRLALGGSHRDPMAYPRLQRHGTKVLLKQAEKEKGRFENRPFSG
jgi:hypothetical protein